jgi:hypothetical protein
MASKYGLIVEDERLWKQFKIRCVQEDITIKDKIALLIKKEVYNGI